MLNWVFGGVFGAPIIFTGIRYLHPVRVGISAGFCLEPAGKQWQGSIGF
jgi:hypothetical protein